MQHTGWGLLVAVKLWKINEHTLTNSSFFGGPDCKRGDVRPPERYHSLHHRRLIENLCSRTDDFLLSGGKKRALADAPRRPHTHSQQTQRHMVTEDSLFLFILGNAPRTPPPLSQNNNGSPEIFFIAFVRKIIMRFSQPPPGLARLIGCCRSHDQELAAISPHSSSV